jgi:small subunit ribosomal protein S15
VLAFLCILEAIVQSASAPRVLPSLSRSFHITSPLNETYKTRKARVVKKKNITKQQTINRSNETDRPDSILGHSKTPEGEKLWAESELCNLLLTPEKILADRPRDIPTASGSISVSQHLNFGIKPQEEELIFQTLPDVTSQQAFFGIMRTQYDSENEVHVRTFQEAEAKAKISAIHLSRLTDLRNASTAGIAVENRRRCVEAFSSPDKPNDTGRSEVQGICLYFRSIDGLFTRFV